MSIHIRSIKHKTEIDGSMYFVKDGQEHVDLSIFHLGHTVTIIYPLTSEQADAVNDMTGPARSYLRAFDRNYGMGSTSDWTAHLRFTVVEVDHALGAGFGRGALRRLSHTVTVEAVDWLTEDLLMWLVNPQKRPPWASELEETTPNA